MDIESKIDLIKRAPTEEILVEDELKNLFETNSKPGHYIGYEISGKLHIGSLIMCGFKINDLSKAGVKTQVFLADWHSFLNNKLEGDWEKIKLAAKYYEEAFKFLCPNVKVVFGSALYHNNDNYWKNVMRISKNINEARALRCMTILGRSEKETLSVAQFFYPSMQAADIHEIGADITQAGMDQRKIYVLAREVYPFLKWKKPVSIHTHLLAGLAEPEKTGEGEEAVVKAKMSKSKPWTCIFIHDTEKEINEKLAKAWCPLSTEANPVLELAKYIIFHEFKTLEVERPAKFGGNVSFEDYTELEKAFLVGKLHPMDLKNAVSVYLNKILKPVREHFEKPKQAKLLDVYKDLKITR